MNIAKISHTQNMRPHFSSQTTQVTSSRQETKALAKELELNADYWGSVGSGAAATGLSLVAAGASALLGLGIGAIAHSEIAGAVTYVGSLIGSTLLGVLPLSNKIFARNALKIVTK